MEETEGNEENDQSNQNESNFRNDVRKKRAKKSKLERNEKLDLDVGRKLKKSKKNEEDNFHRQTDDIETQMTKIAQDDEHSEADLYETSYSILGFI